MGPLSKGAGVNATDYKEFDKTIGIVYESFSPLCGPCEGDDKYACSCHSCVMFVACMSAREQTRQNVHVESENAPV